MEMEKEADVINEYANKKIQVNYILQHKKGNTAFKISQ